MKRLGFTVTTGVDYTGADLALVRQTRIAEQKLGVAFQTVTVTEGLESPWGMAFLPDGTIVAHPGYRCCTRATAAPAWPTA